MQIAIGLLGALLAFGAGWLLGRRSRPIHSYLSQARTDAMTGLPNRRALDEQMEQRFARFRDGGSPFSLALIDVDHFKRINDSHGHLGGDGVLQRIAQWLEDRFGSENGGLSMVARFGGDEFAVISADLAASFAIQMDRLRKEIEQSVFHISQQSARVTVSVGVSQIGDDATPVALIRRADESLYRAKELGRNGTFYDDGHGPTRVGSAEVANTPESQN